MVSDGGGNVVVASVNSQAVVGSLGSEVTGSLGSEVTGIHMSGGLGRNGGGSSYCGDGDGNVHRNSVNGEDARHVGANGVTGAVLALLSGGGKGVSVGMYSKMA